MRLKKRCKELAKYWAYPLYQHVYKPIAHRNRFAVEKQLWEGAPIRACDRTSVMFFTTYKCASVFVGQLMNDLASGAGYQWANFDTLFTHMEVDTHAAYRDPDFQANAFRPRGVIYGPMRHFQPIPALDRYRVLLILRDPRDVLVSHYYSILFSHSIISRKLLDKRRENADKSLDQFVLEQLDGIAGIYETYRDQLLGRGNVLFYPYERMIGEPRAFLSFLREFLGVQVSKEELHAIAEHRMALPKTEDKYSHRRSGRAGQYAERLRPETVHQVEARLAPVLSAFGYSETA